MQEGGKLLAKILQRLVKRVEPGLPTEDLDKLARQLIKKAGGQPAFLNYQGFPAAICTSINEQIVHTPPGKRRLAPGDILSLDIAMRYPAKTGLITDTAVTVPVGEISPTAQALIEVARGSLKLAIAKLKPQLTVAQLGGIIQNFVESRGFYVIRKLVGHGVGRKLHEPPMVPNFQSKFQTRGFVLKEGMTIAIEPMVTATPTEARLAADGFTYETADGSLSAHFEHTVALTTTGARVLTEL